MSTPAPRHPDREGIPRRGDPGVWPWVLHRITGAALFFFVLVLVASAVTARVSPQAFNEVAAIYQQPLVVLVQAVLVAALLFHALNGIRVVLIDFWEPAPRARRIAVRAVGISWLLIAVPVLVVLGVHLFGRPG